MFEEREVISLLLAAGVMVFVGRQRELLRSVQNWPVLFLAFALLFASFAASVIEGVLWEMVLNWGQHLCSAASAVVLAIWCWMTFARKEQAS